MTDADSPGLSQLLRDEKHPRGSPILGRFLSATLCRLGHDIVVMELETWEDDWLACRRCGARFVPADVIGEDTEVIKI